MTPQWQMNWEIFFPVDNMLSNDITLYLQLIYPQRILTFPVLLKMTIKLCLMKLKKTMLLQAEDQKLLSNQPLKLFLRLINKTFKTFMFKKNIYSINNLRVSSPEVYFSLRNDYKNILKNGRKL